MSNSRPLHIPNLGRPPPKPTAPHHTPQPKLSSTLWFFPRPSPPPTQLSHLPLLPQPLTPLPQPPQHHHPPLPLPCPTSNPTLTRHSGSTPTSSPPHRWTRFPLRRGHPISRPPSGARPGAPAPKHHHVQLPPNVPGSARADLPHMLISAADPLCRTIRSAANATATGLFRATDDCSATWLPLHHTTTSRPTSIPSSHTSSIHPTHTSRLAGTLSSTQTGTADPPHSSANTTGQPWPTAYLQHPQSPAATGSLRRFRPLATAPCPKL